MNIDLKILQSERETLKNDFDNLTNRIAKVEKDLGSMRSNLNAVYGAIQQVDKLIKLSNGDDKSMPENKEKALNLATS
jgi:vacuolar-type H+-ATPase subunit D/Vma8